MSENVELLPQPAFVQFLKCLHCNEDLYCNQSGRWFHVDTCCAGCQGVDSVAKPNCVTTDGGKARRAEQVAMLGAKEGLRQRDHAAFVRGYEQAREEAAIIADKQAGKGRTIGDTKAIADKIRALTPVT